MSLEDMSLGEIFGLLFGTAIIAICSLKADDKL